VARGVHDKLVHRHPHVFGDVNAATAEEVASNWEEIKQQEKGRSSVTDGIPNALPALLLSTKLQRKALAVDLHVPAIGDGPAGLPQQIAALADDLPVVADADAPPTAASAAIERLVGDLLFGLADLSRRLGIDPEQALRSRALAFRDLIVALEGQSAREVAG
jgi:uncharacterized protein YabN with tetrapyrrole methylase and pyrophosphatase domain